MLYLSCRADKFFCIWVWIGALVYKFCIGHWNTLGCGSYSEVDCTLCFLHCVSRLCNLCSLESRKVGNELWHKGPVPRSSQASGGKTARPIRHIGLVIAVVMMMMMVVLVYIRSVIFGNTWVLRFACLQLAFLMTLEVITLNYIVPL